MCRGSFPRYDPHVQDESNLRIGHRLVHAGRSVLFIPAYRLVQETLAAKRDLDLPRILRKLDNLYVVFDLQECQSVR